MKCRTTIAVVTVMLALVLTGCAGLSPAELDEFMSGIPAEVPDLSGVPDGTYDGDYRIKPPRGETAFLKHVFVSVTVAGQDISGVVVTRPRALANDPDFVDYAGRVAFAKAVEHALLQATPRGQ
jgi:hypothetical protein